MFLITQLCWLHQVKTNKNMNPFFVPSIPFSSQPFQQYCAAIQSRNKQTWRQTTSLLEDSLDTVRCRVYRNVILKQHLKQQKKKSKTTKPQTASLGLPETTLGAQVHFIYTFTPYYSSLQSLSVVATCDKHNMAFWLFFF